MLPRSGMHSLPATGARRVSLALACLMLAAGAAAPMAAQGEPRRLLVSPVDAGSAVREEPLVQAAPAALAEILGGEGKAATALLHDLSPETMEALELSLDRPPGPRRLTRAKVLERLASAEGVRIVLMPRISSQRVEGEAGFEVDLLWADAVTGDEGAVSSVSPRKAPPFFSLLKRLAAEAHAAWSSGWNAAGDPPTSLAEASLTGVPLAAAGWAVGREAWNSGDVPRAVEALKSAVERDPGFGRALVDLAWIRLAQERTGEAAELAASAVEGGRLSTAALEKATLIRIASTGDGDALLDLAGRLDGGAAGLPRASLARAVGLILRDEYAPSISHLDRVRRHRPNDPAVVHLAGIAGLGAQDYYEARTRLSRAAELWPEHELIRLDLAETAVRSHDLEEADRILREWSAGFTPGAAPATSEEWSVTNPPPPVRAGATQTLQGRISVAVNELMEETARMEREGAGWRVTVPALKSIHELELQLSGLGTPREKQEWLIRARDTYRRLMEVLPEEERRGRPWIYDRLTALLRVREGRLEEAREIREAIMASAGAPGYDPGVEAEIEAAITLKAADAQGHFKACRRRIEVRGLIKDHYCLAQAYAVVRDWPRLEEEYATVRRRLDEWSVNRRQDSYTWGPMDSGHIPFMYYLGAVARLNQGDAGGARERFETFLAYFKDPDRPLMIFKRDAADRGAEAAW